MTNKEKFSIWIEFEEWLDKEDKTEECFNISVSVDNKEKYALNAWPYNFAKSILDDDELKLRDDPVDQRYYYGFSAPDTFVREMTRESVEQTIYHMIDSGEIENFVIKESKNLNEN